MWHLSVFLRRAVGIFAAVTHISPEPQEFLLFEVAMRTDEEPWSRKSKRCEAGTLHTRIFPKGKIREGAPLATQGTYLLTVLTLPTEGCVRRTIQGLRTLTRPPRQPKRRACFT